MKLSKSIFECIVLFKKQGTGTSGMAMPSYLLVQFEPQPMMLK